MNSALAIYENFAQTKDIATALASSELIPVHFRGKPANILIALEFAHRNDIPPFQAMQSLFVVHGTLGMSAAMAIALARKHNAWKSLRYRVMGRGESLAVTAIATLHDGTEVDSTVTFEMAKKAGWTKNAVYQSIPEQMLRYRAAAFLIRANFPEVLFGMQTREEIEDVHAAKTIKVDPKSVIDIQAISDEKTYEPVVNETVTIEPKEQTATIHLNEETTDEFKELWTSITEFIESRPSDWFPQLGKLKDNVLSVMNHSKTVKALKSIETTLVKLDEKYAELQGAK